MAQDLDFTEKELIALKNFRHQINDLKLDWFSGHNYSLMRWLRARELNVDKAENMLRQSLEWRKVRNIDSILSTTLPAFMLEQFPFQVLGFDKSGYMVGLVPYGKWDFRTLVEAGNKQYLVNYVNYIIELAYKLCRNRSSSDKVACKLIIILDLEGFSIRQVLHKQTIEFLLGILQDLENNHPEALECGILVNCPKIWEVLWAIAKPLMTARTLSKVMIEGSKSALWRQKILDVVPHNIVPSQYGGSNTTVPNMTHYYEKLLKMDLTKEFDIEFEKNRPYSDDELEQVVVDAGSKFEQEIHVPATGATLRWGFKTDLHDIGFTVTNEDEERVVDVSRADAHKNTQLGTLRCPQQGKYTFSFDNTYSRFTPKTLYYKIDVCELDEEEDLSDDYVSDDRDGDDDPFTDDYNATDL